MNLQRLLSKARYTMLCIYMATHVRARSRTAHNPPLHSSVEKKARKQKLFFKN